MLPVVAIVGRPNVGKSTLFNALTRTRDALVADRPGVTRDRQYGICQADPVHCVLVDTGGLVDKGEEIEYLTAKQVHQAIDEASLVLFVVSARDGRMPADEEVAAALRRHNCAVLVVGNKTDGTDPDITLADFAALGMGDPIGVSAAHRRGLNDLLDQMAERLPPEPEAPMEREGIRRLAVVGRPNVGKSTLVNRLLGEERVMAFDQPGTTRDSIATRLDYDGIAYELVDTAGVRRRAKVRDAVEKFSTIKALQEIDRAHVVILMIDATEGLTDQDTTLLAHIIGQGRGMVIALNKWDGLAEEHRAHVLSEIDRRLVNLGWARKVRISALHGSGMKHLMKAVDEAWRNATRELPTAELSRVLTQAVEKHQPPLHQGRSAKLRYAHGGGKLPLRIIVHGTRVDTVPAAYRRYLENVFIRHFRIVGTPLVVEFRSGSNPFEGRKNRLTDRQLAKRKRLKKFTGRKTSR